LERAYTKPEIMELYLNQIYFGEGAYGVQVASKTYFNKDVSKLGLGEVALLAGIIRRPEGYSPFEDEQRAIDRRDRVLSLMREEGYITAEEAEQAKATRLVFNPNRKPLARGGYTSPWFVSYVIKQFVDQYGADALYKGQFTIYTTLNPDMQKAAEEAVRDGLRRNRRQRVSQMALVAVDVHTGAIKAMVGGADFNKNQYNVAAQGIGRQAGSAFKPFVYTAALLQGDTPESKVDDTKVRYPAGNGRWWEPHNYETGKYHGRVTYRNALAHSFNVAAVRVAERVGIDSVIEVASKLGIPESKMDPYLSTALGTASVTPLEMASAFAVFSTGGMRTEPYAIQKIVDARGRTVDERQPVTWRVLDEGVAYTMVDMLEDVIKYGTAGRIRHLLSFHAAGKTGTSSSYRDAWFVGFTDDLSAAVWSGNLHSEPTAHGAGGTVSAPVWADFMVKAEPIMVAARKAGQEERAQEITPPKVHKPKPAAAEATDPAAADGDEVVTPPDGEANPDAPAAGDETDPQTGDAGDQADTGGVVYKRICSASGLLAGRYCPASEVNEVGYDARHGGRPPTRVCDVHTGRTARTTEARTSGRQGTRAVGKVTVSVCAITKKLATPYCPVVQNITVDADKIPTETCTRHARR
jgi:penicillin-binding protein 1A